jgi:heme exporter protein C
MKRALMFSAAAASAVLFLWTQHLIFFEAPMQHDMLFFNQKIFYYHVPMWFVLFLAVIICGVSSLLYLKRRDGRYDDVALAAAEISVLFGAAGLITGSIWAKVAWGAWWVWDARLTTSLLLWMLMLGYVLVRKYGGPGSERLAAGLGVFAMIDIPLIYFSVRIWRTYHPDTSTVPGLDPAMRPAFWLSVLLFFVFFAMLMAARIGQVRATRRVHACRERALDAGLLD